jgi:WD40 repeat protein
MHVKTVQIEWHGNLVQAGDKCKWVPEPIYSVDFHPSGSLMTGGGDKEIRVWKVNQGCWIGPDQNQPSRDRPGDVHMMWHVQVEQGKDGYATVDYKGKLPGHDKTVNCVRFSPSGKLVAGRPALGCTPAVQSACRSKQWLQGAT